jgi:poly(hydroxyalkanoate) depolymerase family esterase
MRSCKQSVSTLTLMLFMLGASAAASAGQPGSYFAGYYTNVWGSRYYQGYAPSSYSGSPMPLVVALHGCTETAADFQALSRFDVLAEQRGFIVVFPEQNPLANSGRCWNWFLSLHQRRGQGEPSLIAGITNTVRSLYQVDPNRIYVTGLSAGGAMTVVMGATYPDLFAAIGVHSGCGWKGLPCNLLGGGDPVAAGNDIYTTMGSFSRVVPVFAIVGSADPTTPAINTQQIITQWAQANDRASDGVDNDNIDDTPEQTLNGQVPAGRTYTRYLYRNGVNNSLVLERVVVNSMTHRWSGGPGYHVFGDPSGPDATTMIYDFFVAHPK